MTGKTALSRLFRRLGGRDRIDDIRALPDRRVLIETYIPALARIGGRVLWIGCRAYTRQDYPALARHGAEVWTTDIDPKAARWGQPGRHRTGDVCAIDQVFAEQTFDAEVSEISPLADAKTGTVIVRAKLTSGVCFWLACCSRTRW